MLRKKYLEWSIFVLWIFGLLIDSEMCYFEQFTWFGVIKIYIQNVKSDINLLIWYWWIFSSFKCEKFWWPKILIFYLVKSGENFQVNKIKCFWNPQNLKFIRRNCEETHIFAFFFTCITVFWVLNLQLICGYFYITSWVLNSNKMF